MDLDMVEAVRTGPAALDVGDWDEGHAFLAGGSYLYSEPQPHLRQLHDLTSLGWPALSTTADGLGIGATCTLGQLHAASFPAPWRAAHELVGPCCEALWGSFKVWEVATVGGNICLGLPAGPMTALTAALNGTARLLAPGGGSRTVPVAAFVRGTRDTALRPGEVLREVWLPPHALTARTALRRSSLHPIGRSAALVIGRRDADDTTVVTVTAATARPVQLRFAAPPTPELALAALDAADPPWVDDVHGAAPWRVTMTRRHVTEVVAELAAPDVGRSPSGTTT